MGKKNRKMVAAGIAALHVLGAVSMVLLFPMCSEADIRPETVKARISSVSSSVTATGTVEPVTEVEVGTQVSGKIAHIYVDFNDVVRNGQLIAEMDKETLQAELESAQAELEACRVEYEYQEKVFARTRTLYEKKLVSEQEYDSAKYSYDRSKASYDKSKASMVKVKRNLEYADITSPIDGVIINRAVEEGQTVAAGLQTPTLFTIAEDLKSMQVIADVDEADIGQVKEGQRVEFYVDAYPDDIFRGTVKQVRLEAVVESNVTTYEVVIDAPNPDLKLKPGLTANITVYTVERENALTVPFEALKFMPDPVMAEKMGYSLEGMREEGSAFLWVLKDSVLRRRAVKTGIMDGDRIEILSGITADDVIVAGLSAGEAESKVMPKSERSPFMPAGPGRRK